MTLPSRGNWEKSVLVEPFYSRKYEMSFSAEQSVCLLDTTLHENITHQFASIYHLWVFKKEFLNLYPFSSSGLCVQIGGTTKLTGYHMSVFFSLLPEKKAAQAMKNEQAFSNSSVSTKRCQSMHMRIRRTPLTFVSNRYPASLNPFQWSSNGLGKHNQNNCSIIKFFFYQAFFFFL